MNYIKTFESFSSFTSEEDTKPFAVIVDVDGTICDNSEAFSYDRCPFYKPNQDVVELVKQYHDNNNHIIILTARDYCVAGVTKEWLRYHDIPFTQCFFKSEKDYRPNSEYKKWHYENDIAPKYNVVCCLEDNPDIVAMWQDLGLRTIHITDNKL